MTRSKTAGQILKSARLKKDWTQAQVAEKAGLHVNTYAKIERGVSRPEYESAAKLMKALDIDPSLLPQLLK